MSGALDRALIDASCRFEEKLNLLRNTPPGKEINFFNNLPVERGFNIRSKLLHIPSLQDDKHFLALLGDVEKFTSQDWQYKADNKHLLYTYTAHLLKLLLKDTLSISDLAERKMNLEKTYLWFKDRKRILVDFRLAMEDPNKGVTVAEEGRKKGPSMSELVSLSSFSENPKEESSVYGLREKTPEKSARDRNGTVTTIAFDQKEIAKANKKARRGNLQVQAGGLPPDQLRAFAVTQKLQIYKTRNLKKSAEYRRECKHASETGASTPGKVKSSPKVVYKAKKANPDSIPGHISFPNEEPGAFLAQGNQRSASPTSLKYSPEYKQAVQGVERIWVQSRALEIQEKLDDMEFQDTISLWSHNQARVEEEANRRQEASQMSSQLGKACHANLRSSFELESVTNSRSSTPALTADFTNAAIVDAVLSTPQKKTDSFRSASPFSPTPKRAPSRPNPIFNVIPEPEPTARAFGVTLATPEKNVISLSPYDHFNVAADNPNMRLLRSPNSVHGNELVVTPDSPQLPGMRAKGIKHTHPESMRSTSLLNQRLDVMSDAKTTFAPSVDHSLLRVARNAGQMEEEEEAPTKGKKGEEKKRAPADPSMLDLIFPFLSTEQEVPSILRMQQMDQVEKVRECFVRSGMYVSLAELEKGLMTPEDRPFAECVTNLPAPEDGLIRDFTKNISKPKKGGKAKK